MNLLIKLWTIWCFIFVPILFTIFVLFSIIILVFFGNLGKKLFYLLSPYFAQLCLLIMGVNIRKSGFNTFSNNNPVIYIANHKSYLDIFIIAAIVPGKLKYLGKEEVFNWPVFGWLAKVSGQIPVKRDSKESRSKSYDLMKAALCNGYSVILFPEGGWKNNNDSSSPNPYNLKQDKILQNFRNGAFRLSIESVFPIVPIVLLNAQNRFSDVTNKMVPGVADVHIFSPINPIDYNVETLNNKCYNLILDKLLKYTL